MASDPRGTARSSVRPIGESGWKAKAPTTVPPAPGTALPSTGSAAICGWNQASLAGTTILTYRVGRTILPAAAFQAALLVAARIAYSANRPENIRPLNPLPCLHILPAAAPPFAKITDACETCPTPESGMLEACALSDKGCVRANNEDYSLVDPKLGLYVLADGMGGAKAGERASRLAVETVSDCITGAPSRDSQA